MSEGAKVVGASDSAVTYVGPSASAGALGFTSRGIASKSSASGIMSASAKANGGSVSRGSVTATCQSIGTRSTPKNAVTMKSHSTGKGSCHTTIRRK